MSASDRAPASCKFGTAGTSPSIFTGLVPNGGGGSEPARTGVRKFNLEIARPDRAEDFGVDIVQGRGTDSDQDLEAWSRDFEASVAQ